MRIAVDLTPVLPGGENGGAKLMTLELIRRLARIAPDHEWVLLTSWRTHEELATLDGPSVRRLCVLWAPDAPALQGPWQRLGAALRGAARRLPAPVKMLLRRLRARLRPVRPASLLKDLGADLLFAPLTAPFLADPWTPTVSVVYDLQHRCYPQFFPPQEVAARERNFRDACRTARRIVCISDFVRGTVLERGDATPEQVSTIHIRLPYRVGPASADSRREAAGRHGLRLGRFLLYPANFWAHKNHAMLFTALGIYLRRHPESDLKLACTGAPGPRLEYLRDAVRRMGLDGRIVFPGFVSDAEFAALLSACKAVIFPSLYEGFGMPLLEAMAARKPVLCSSVTSLPEVGGDAALYFDPRRPGEIVAAIERLEQDPELAPRLLRAAEGQLRIFGDADRMAREYLEVFRQVLEAEVARYALHGSFPDGWFGDRAKLEYPSDAGERWLELELNAPPWVPFRFLHFTLRPSDGESESHRLRRGSSVEVRRKLPRDSGAIEIAFDTPFQPLAYGIGDDLRLLGAECTACRIVCAGSRIELYPLS